MPAALVATPAGGAAVLGRGSRVNGDLSGKVTGETVWWTLAAIEPGGIPGPTRKLYTLTVNRPDALTGPVPDRLRAVEGGGLEVQYDDAATKKPVSVETYDKDLHLLRRSDGGTEAPVLALACNEFSCSLSPPPYLIEWLPGSLKPVTISKLANDKLILWKIDVPSFTSATQAALTAEGGVLIADGETVSGTHVAQVNPEGHPAWEAWLP